MDTDRTPHLRTANSGRTFVYLLPCRDEDVLKVGFSRDPVQRMRTLHRRFFECFDLDRGLLIETERLREARRIERCLINAFGAQRTSAPLAVRQVAAGHTEWFRGVSPQAEALARSLCEKQGLRLHMPLRSWLRDQLEERSTRLFDWSRHMFDALEYEYFNVPPEARDELGAKALRDALDTCAAVGMELPSLVSTEVLDWYATDDYFGRRRLR